MKKKSKIPKKKIFCGGICEEWKRHQIKCVKCRKFICKKCLVIYRETNYCKDCVINEIDLKKDIWKAIIEAFS